MRMRITQLTMVVVLSFFVTGILINTSEPVYAQGALEGSFKKVENIKKQNNINAEDPQDFIVNGLAILMSLVAVVAAAVLVWGGFMYVTSAGDEEKAKKAKSLILYAIAGLVIIGAAAIVVNVIINTVIKG